MLDDWRALAVEGHFTGRRPWMPYHERARRHWRDWSAQAAEVVAMNTLTVNLHLMLASFYRPTGERRAILIEKARSRRTATRSHRRCASTASIPPRPDRDRTPHGRGAAAHRGHRRAIERDGARIATVMLPGVQYLTGQRFDLAAITRAGHARAASSASTSRTRSATCGRAARLGRRFRGLVPLQVSERRPRRGRRCFVHERHAHRRDLPRFAGWWGHDKATRFRMGPEFSRSPAPKAGNSAIRRSWRWRRCWRRWSCSTRPACRRCAQVGGADGLSRDACAGEAREAVTILTPADPEARGASAVAARARRPRRARAVFEALRRRGIVGDWREPDVIRIAPVPLYNSFDDAWRFADALRAELAA